jgi:hypothetical protein
MGIDRPRTYDSEQDKPGRSERDDPRQGGLPRRNFVRLALVGAAGLLLAPPTPLVWARRSRARSGGSWSDPGTWNGNVPGPNDVAVISSDVILDTDARVAGVIVEPGATLSFLRTRSVTLKSSENVIVRGRLSMRPEQPSINHRLRFVDVDESKFVGDGKKVRASDVGLWVMGNGVLDVAGSQKRAWTRTASGVPADATVIKLRRDPTGWRVGDRIVLTPTGSPAKRNFHRAYDEARIKSIKGRTVTLTKPTRFAHPAVEVREGQRFTPEVLNLTRNVAIEGTPKGRAHVFIHSQRPQSVEHVLIEHMGPRHVRGRYGFHFHECRHTSHGSIVKGAVVTSCGNHAFVPHGSHGIKFISCISHDTMEDPFWWDFPEEETRMMDFSQGLTWDHCVASLVRTDPREPELRQGGFTLAAGKDNVIRNCVATGVQGGKESSGFHWRAEGGGLEPWVVGHNVSHNNERNGAFNWQNDRRIGKADRFVAYHNGGFGISQGAYRNPYRFTNAVLYGNALAAVKLDAVSTDAPLRFVDSVFDGAGLSEHLVVTDDHRVRTGVPTEFVRCKFKGYKHAAVWVAADRKGGGIPNWIDLVDCSFEDNEFFLHQSAAPETRLRVRDRAHGRITVQRWDRPGRPKREWNASVWPGWRS